MTDPLSVVTTLGQGALKLKTIIDGVRRASPTTLQCAVPYFRLICLQLAENQKNLYKVASELIDQIQEIEEIRKGHVSDSLAELDDSLSRLQKCVL